MAAPAIALAVKSAAATDKRTWKEAGILIAAILTPVILAVVVILSLLSGTFQHNNTAVDLCFNGGAFPSPAPAEYTAHIEDMRNCFPALEQAFSGAEARSFVDCFVKYEERTRTVKDAATGEEKWKPKRSAFVSAQADMYARCF